MKKLLIIIISCFLLVSTVTGCGKKPEEEKKKLSIVTTIFPEYDWVKEVIGDEIDNIELTMLLDNGVDLHSFQPTATDIMKVATCDLFIYVGGESDEWVEDALEEATNKQMLVINLLDVLGEGVKEEEIIEGMEAEEEEEEGKEEEEIEYDEHVWLSLKNAQIYVDVISEAVSILDAENTEKYKANAAAYKAKLSSLDEQYLAATTAAANKTLLFGDRFPFRYLVDDYGLNYYAAFVGCSAETEASFETIVFLANKLNELNLSSVMVIESSDKRIAETIVSSSDAKNQKILVLDSMQSVTSKDVDNNVTYLSIMESNLNVIKDALK